VTLSTCRLAAGHSQRLQSGGISIFRLAEGRIAEHWEQLDRLASMQELGVVPAPGARPAREATGESRR
jgi:hypothetical protein